MSVFKVGLTLELTRRENDEKIIALNLTMCDMVETLKLCVRRSYFALMILTRAQTQGCLYEGVRP